METIPRTSGPAKVGPVQAPPEISPGADQGGGGLPQSVSSLREKRRGVQAGQKRGTYDKGAKPAAKSPAVSSATLPSAVPMFTEANTKIIVGLPFKLAYVKSGYPGFLLTPLEEETLLATGVNVLNQWVTLDPKYTALGLFGVSLLTITAEKFFSYRSAVAEAIKAQAEEALKKSAGNGGQP